MFKNNNGGMIRRFTYKSVRANKARNLFLVLSIIMVTTMLMVVFGAGISLVNNFEVAQTRFKGTTANGMLTELTAERYDQLAAADYIKDLGIQQYAGTLAEAEIDKEIIFTYYDQVEWEQHIEPTIMDVRGSYPEQENEIMLTEWSALQLGMGAMEIGAELTLNFEDTKGQAHTENFVVTGYYKDFMALNQSGTHGNGTAALQYFANQQMSFRAEGNIAVSQKFAGKYGGEDSKVAIFSFQDSRITAEEALERLEEDIPAEGKFVVSGLRKESAGLFAGPLLFLIVLIGLIIVCGYLLIYNIISISVIRDMHMYGQLKTLGATMRQLKQVVLGQALYLSVIGIPAGIVTGVFLSIIAIPFVLKTVTAGNNFEEAMPFHVSLSPILFIFVVVFALLTVIFSSLKPAKLAGRVSPAEAVRYQENTNIRRKLRKSSKGAKLYRMAFRNVFRSKKRALVVFLSLFLGLLIYLIVNVLTFGTDFNTRYEREMPDNFMLTNFSLESPVKEQWKDKFDEEFIKTVEGIEGVKEIHEIKVASISAGKTDAVVKEYLDKRASLWEEEATEEITAIGTDWDIIKNFPVRSSFSAAEIRELLASGEGILLETAAGMDHVVGQQVTLGESTAYTVAGILEVVVTEGRMAYRYTDYILPEWISTTPAVIMDQAGLDRIGAESYTQQVKIWSEGTNEEEIQEHLYQLIEDDDDIQYAAQILDYQSYAPLIGTIRMIGTVFSFLLLFLGVLNFVNVMITSILSRQKELAALESIGMTQKQIRWTLTLEGLYYGLFTIVLLATLGTLISFLVMQLAKKILYFFVFGFPFAAILTLVLILTIICIVTPNLAYRSITKESVVERLRKGVD